MYKIVPSSPTIIPFSLSRNAISRSLESKGDAEISSSLIGEQVMDALRQIDQIAYVRFASVYRNFSEASDFQKFLGQELEK